MSRFIHLFKKLTLQTHKVVYFCSEQFSKQIKILEKDKKSNQRKPFLSVQNCIRCGQKIKQGEIQQAKRDLMNNFQDHYNYFEIKSSPDSHYIKLLDQFDEQTHEPQIKNFYDCVADNEQKIVGKLSELSLGNDLGRKQISQLLQQLQHYESILDENVSLFPSQKKIKSKQIINEGKIKELLHLMFLRLKKIQLSQKQSRKNSSSQCQNYDEIRLRQLQETLSSLNIQIKDLMIEKQKMQHKHLNEINQKSVQINELTVKLYASEQKKNEFKIKQELLNQENLTLTKKNSSLVAELDKSRYLERTKNQIKTLKNLVDDIKSKQEPEVQDSTQINRNFTNTIAEKIDLEHKRPKIPLLNSSFVSKQSKMSFLNNYNKKNLRKTEQPNILYREGQNRSEFSIEQIDSNRILQEDLKNELFQIADLRGIESSKSETCKTLNLMQKQSMSLNDKTQYSQSKQLIIDGFYQRPLLSHGRKEKKAKTQNFQNLNVTQGKNEKKMLHEKNNQFPRVKKVDHDKLSPHQINEQGKQINGELLQNFKKTIQKMSSSQNLKQNILKLLYEEQLKNKEKADSSSRPIQFEQFCAIYKNFVIQSLDQKQQKQIKQVKSQHLQKKSSASLKQHLRQSNFIIKPKISRNQKQNLVDISQHNQFQYNSQKTSPLKAKQKSEFYNTFTNLGQKKSKARIISSSEARELIIQFYINQKNIENICSQVQIYRAEKNPSNCLLGKAELTFVTHLMTCLAELKLVDCYSYEQIRQIILHPSNILRGEEKLLQIGGLEIGQIHTNMIKYALGHIIQIHRKCAKISQETYMCKHLKKIVQKISQIISKVKQKMK